MKRKIVIIALAIVAIYINACNDLLQKEPIAKLSTSSAYKTKDDALKAVTAAYQPLRENMWYNSRGNNPAGYMYYVFGDIASDDAWKGGGSGSDQLAFKKISDFNVTPTNAAVESAWKELYIGVHRANLVLDHVPNIDMNSGLKDRLLAEAKFLRGYYYFQLVKVFGDVPLVLKSELKNYNLSRTPKDKVYKQIIKDFKNAANVLPVKSGYSDSNIGRITKGAAQGYLGKVYLYMHDYSNAENWFGKIINSGEYSLDPDYYHMFTIDGENGPGSIFEIDYVHSSKYFTGNIATGTARGSRGMYGWGFVNPTQDFANAFENGDPRLHYSIYADGDTMPDGQIADVGNSVSGYLDKKVYVLLSERQSDEKQVGKDEVMMRLGKVLLWYAEAANEVGDTQKALKAVNRVRKRAREGDPTVLPDVTVTNKKALRKKIWHEERVEYGLEHERFFDLVRHGQAAEVLHNFANSYNTSKGANYQKGVNDIFPIPQSEINLSHGKLEQDKDY